MSCNHNNSNNKVLKEIDINSFEPEPDIDENPTTPSQLFASVSTPPRISRIRADAPPPTVNRDLENWRKENSFTYNPNSPSLAQFFNLLGDELIEGSHDYHHTDAKRKGLRV